MRWEWGDLAYLVAVAEAGTTLGAARRLGVNQTTCARRLAALERALGLTLFDRSASGYALTEQGRALLDVAREAAAAADRFGAAADALARTVTGTIRLSTNDAIADGLIAPAISRFRALYPGVRVVLDISERLVDLAAGEADIAIRGAALAATDQGLVQRRLPDTAWAIYCAAVYAAAAPPVTPATIEQHPIASLDNAVLRATLRDYPQARVVDVTNSTRSLVAMLQSGYCIGALPCFVGDRAEGLERCLTLPDPAPLWLVYAERLRRRPEGRALLDEIVRCIEAARPLLAGEGHTSGST